MTVSVVVPAFTHPHRMLVDALDSILGQTTAPDEVIVVDDGAPEEIAPQLADFGDAVSVIRQSNQGIGSARNTGVRASTGSYLAFLDSDDVWEPTKLEQQMAVLDADTSVDVVYGQVEQFYDFETDDDFRTRHPIMHDGPAFLASAMLIRREAFDRVGDFANSKGGVDIDWQLRQNELGLECVMLDKVVFRRRIHHNNLGQTDRDQGNRERLRALKRSLDRRRSSRPGSAVTNPAGEDAP